MAALRLYQIDAFTRDRFMGNPAGVVTNAAALDERQMLLIARELPRFRRMLDVATNPICGKCVCSTKIGWRNLPWQ